MRKKELNNNQFYLYYGGITVKKNRIIKKSNTTVKMIIKVLFALSSLVLITATGCVSTSGGRKDLTLLTEDFWKNATVQSVQDKIAEGGNVNIADENGIPALTYALIFNESPDVAKVLLNAGADVNQKNKWGTAVMGGFLHNKGVTVEKLSLLMEYGADVNNVDDVDGNTSLSIACTKKNPEIIQFLVDAGADVNRAAIDEWTPLLLAARYNENPEVLQILIDAGADVNYAKGDGLNVLMASMHNHGGEDVGEESPDIVRTRILLNAGADVNMKSKDGQTALIYAANDNIQTVTSDRITMSFRTGDDPAVVKMLIKAGADVKAANKWGTTALLRASRYNREEVVSILLDAGADVNKTDNEGWSPLKLAARYNEDEGVTRLLLDAGADIQDEYLYLAAGYNLNYNIGTLLIEAGADVNYRFGQNSWTPLMAAVKYNFDTNMDNDLDKNLEWVKLLLNAGADVNAVSNDGYTPLLAAMGFNEKEVEGADGKINNLLAINNDAEVARLFLEAGADVNKAILPKPVKLDTGGELTKLSPEDGRTPIILAAEQNSIDVMKVLLEYNADVNLRDRSGATALMLACVAWQQGSMSPKKVDLLLEAGADSTIKTTDVVKVFWGTNDDGKNLYANFDEGQTALAFLETNVTMEKKFPADYSRLLELLK